MLVRVTATKTNIFLLADILFNKENCERADDDVFIFVVELMLSPVNLWRGIGMRPDKGEVAQWWHVQLGSKGPNYLWKLGVKSEIISVSCWVTKKRTNSAFWKDLGVRKTKKWVTFVHFLPYNPSCGYVVIDWLRRKRRGHGPPLHRLHLL